MRVMSFQRLIFNEWQIYRLKVKSAIGSLSFRESLKQTMIVNHLYSVNPYVSII